MFPLDLPSGTTEVLLRVKRASMLLPVRFMASGRLCGNAENSLNRARSAYGGVAILLCYNLFCSSPSGRPAICTLSLAMLGYLGVESMLNGFAFAYLWPSQVAWNRMALVPISNLALIFLMMFSHSFYDQNRSVPGLKKYSKPYLLLVLW